MSNKYEIALIKDLRKNDQFLYGYNKLSLRDRYVPMSDFTEDFGVFGYIRCQDEFGHVQSINTYGDFPVVKLKD